MCAPDKRIIKFIIQHHVLTLATSQNNEPWIAHCFYVYDAVENRFIFSSDLKTRHAQEAIKNQFVAGGIALETKIVGKIQGLQFQAIMKPLKDEALKAAKKMYLKKYPYAILMETTLWELSLTFLKLTDNNLGFGKKLIWKK